MRSSGSASLAISTVTAAAATAAWTILQNCTAKKDKDNEKLRESSSEYLYNYLGDDVKTRSSSITGCSTSSSPLSSSFTSTSFLCECASVSAGFADTNQGV